MFSMRLRCPHAVGALSFAARRARVPLGAPGVRQRLRYTMPPRVCLVMYVCLRLLQNSSREPCWLP